MIKVLIVDDSALIRKVLTKVFEGASNIEVVGTASDPYIARDKIKLLNPDVITLDIEMPRMDGITFLRNLMRLRPVPVVMISTLTQKGAPATLAAMESGAVDYVGKPSADNPEQLMEYAEEIIEKVKMASVANIGRLEQQASRHPLHVKPVERVGGKSDKLIAIGASTGGTEALREMLMMMPPDSPPIVVTQHIPPVFSTSFSKRLNDSLPLEVHEADDGDKILPGHVYIAPGGQQMSIYKKAGAFYCKVFDGERVNLHKPSVEVLFDSVAQEVGNKAIGVMLTGMGADGAQAMLRMKQAGSYNIVQDEATCVVWGMPGAVVDIEGHDKVLPLDKIAHEVVMRSKLK